MSTVFLFLALAAMLVIASAVIVLQRVNGNIRHGFTTLVPQKPQATVTATLEIDSTDPRFVNLVVANAGATPAYDVQISLTPEMPLAAGQDERPKDWADTSLLRPGHAAINFAGEIATITDLDFAVDISWRNAPEDQSRTSMTYKLRTNNLERQVPLSAPDTEALLAEIRRLRRDWRSVARGRQPLRVELLPEPVRVSAHDASGATATESRRN